MAQKRQLSRGEKLLYDAEWWHWAGDKKHAQRLLRRCIDVVVTEERPRVTTTSAQTSRV